jgi:hypothetical protein
MPSLRRSCFHSQPGADRRRKHGATILDDPASQSRRAKRMRFRSHRRAGSRPCADWRADWRVVRPAGGWSRLRQSNAVGSLGAIAFITFPEATRVFIPFGSAGKRGMSASQPAGNSPRILSSLVSTLRLASRRCGDCAGRGFPTKYDTRARPRNAQGIV